MTAAELATVLAGVVAVGVLAETVRRHWARRGAAGAVGRRWLAAGMSCMALSLLADTRLSERTSRVLLGSAQGGELVSTVTVMGAAWCAGGFVRSLRGPGTSAARAAVALAICAAVEVTLGLVGALKQPGLGRVVFALVSGGYVAVWLVLLSRALHRATTRVGPELRRGLRLSRLGVVLGALALTTRAVGLVVLDAPVRSPVALLLAATALLVFAAGVSLADWTRGVRQWRNTRRRRRELWAVALLDRLVQPVWRDAASGREFAADTYRRVLRIRDAQLKLRPYVHPGVRPLTLRLAWRDGVSATRAAELAEAAELVTALEAFQRGQRYGGRRELGELHLGDDLQGGAVWSDDELPLLLGVATAVRRDPRVAQVRAWATQQVRGPDGRYVA